MVSHHVQLCARGASYVVALDNGILQFAGGCNEFLKSDIIKSLVQAVDGGDEKEAKTEPVVEDEFAMMNGDESESSSTIAPAPSEKDIQRRVPRKLVEEEKRAVGRIGKDIWGTYFWACGSGRYWIGFALIMVVASLSPVFENGWLRYVYLSAPMMDHVKRAFFQILVESRI